MFLVVLGSIPLNCTSQFVPHLSLVPPQRDTKLVEVLLNIHDTITKSCSATLGFRQTQSEHATGAKGHCRKVYVAAMACQSHSSVAQGRDCFSPELISPSRPPAGRPATLDWTAAR